MVQKLNAHRLDIQLQVGDKVLVHLQPYHQTTVAQQASQKLAKRYYGPFIVLKRIGIVAYRLDLPTGYEIHPIFHILVLKHFYGSIPMAIHSVPANSKDNKPLSLLCGSKRNRKWECKSHTQNT